jgi:NAD(P)-dependent dehydrogenase (short-subunit alcohol dehydrogenase family)
MGFEGTVALITGGASGIGLATARRLGEEGAHVIVLDRRPGAGREAERELRGRGIEADFLAGDVTSEDDVRRAVDEVVARRGRIDVLVNNAAISYPVRFLEADTETWRRPFDVIVQGAYLCSREVARRMVELGIGGCVVNVSSINGSRALDASSHYNAGKGALDQLTRCLALELAPHGIRVNAVAPGFIDTPMSIVEGENELTTEWFRSIYLEGRRIPLGRAGQAEEVARAIAFLASEESSYVCGAILPVDGGLAVSF